MNLNKEVKEYECLYNWSELKKVKKELKDQIDEKVSDKPEENWEGLGLHFEKGELKVHWFAGQVWLTKDIVLRVKPKIDNLNYFQIYLACLSDPLVNQHLNNCIKFFWEGKPISLKEQKIQITPLIVCIYLQKLLELCRRHIKNNFIKVEKNLIGKVKGKPLIKQQIRKNLFFGRLDRVYCQYQIHSIDTRENQILRAALEQCTKYMSQFLSNQQGIDHLWYLANFSRSFLSGVSLRRIYPSDFSGIQYGGFLKPYKKPHNLAKLILRLLGTDPNEEITRKKEAELPPFAIDMNELFERYCEVLLRREGYKVWAGYWYKDRNLGETVKVRPDFLIKNKGYILDSKYRTGWNFNDDYRHDIYQVVAYSRHVGKKPDGKEQDSKMGVLHKLGIRDRKTGKPDKIFILYPCDTKDNEEPDKDINLETFAEKYENNKEYKNNDFQVPIYKYPVKLPVKDKKEERTDSYSG